MGNKKVFKSNDLKTSELFGEPYGAQIEPVFRNLGRITHLEFHYSGLILAVLNLS